MENSQQTPASKNQNNPDSAEDDAQYTEQEKPFADGKGTVLGEEFEISDKEDLE